MGQYAYATPALLAAKGLTEADREPARLLAAPPTALLTPVEDMERAFWQGTQVGPRGGRGRAAGCCPAHPVPTHPASQPATDISAPRPPPGTARTPTHAAARARHARGAGPAAL